MEDSKSGVLMDDLRNYLENTNGDIFEMIKGAIMVAASDRPTEFQIRRHEIAKTLHSGDLMKCSGSCDEYKKKSPKVISDVTEDQDTKIVGTTNKEINDHKSGDDSEIVVPLMKKRIVIKRNNIQLITAEIKVDKAGVYNDQGLGLVMMMKEILEKTSSGDESELEVCEILRRLDTMGLSMKTLEATMIGKTVNALRKHHASEKVRAMAVRLVKEWKRTAVQEWTNKQSDDVKQTSQQQVKPTNVSMMINNREKKLEGSEKATKIGNIGGVRMMDSTSEKLKATKSLQLKPANVKDIINKEKKLEGDSEKSSKIGNGGGVMNVMMDSLKKLEATKRKLREGYAKVENMKKKRRIQVMELYEVTKQGLLPHVKKPIKRQMGNWRR